jgi:hypothetical protein
MHILVEERARMELLPDVPSYAKILIMENPAPVSLSFQYEEDSDLTVHASLLHHLPSALQSHLSKYNPQKMNIYSKAKDNDPFKEEYIYLCLSSKEGIRFTMKVSFPFGRPKKSELPAMSMGGMIGGMFKRKVAKETDVQEVRRERYDPQFMTQV